MPLPPAPVESKLESAGSFANTSTTTEVSGRQKFSLRRLILQTLFVLATIAAIRYLTWRACCTFNPAVRWFFYLFLAAEIMGLLETLLFYFTAWHPQHHRPRPALKNRTVDIFITT